MADSVQFVAYPDISNGDLLSMRFSSTSFEEGLPFFESDTIDTSIDSDELFQLMNEHSTYIEGSRSSGGITIYGRDGQADINYLLQCSNNTVWVTVAGNGPDSTGKWIEDFTEGCPEVTDPGDPDHIKVTFWMMTNSPVSTARNLEIFHWEDTERNYPAEVGTRLSDLFDSGPPTVGGKLILWHGPPGGGKTSAIKVLADRWRSWAKTEYITDPEAFFGSAGYMLTVLNKPTPRDEDGEEMWRLVVVEDAGQFVSKDADVHAGQAFSRLLNLTDGMLGQGMKTIVLITTNQPLKEMHEALRRPGRCMANIQFDDFTASEASAWLGQPVSESMSLAAMYEKLNSTQIANQKEAVSTGQYL